MRIVVDEKNLERMVKKYFSKKYGNDIKTKVELLVDEYDGENICNCEVIPSEGIYRYVSFNELAMIISEELGIDYSTARFKQIGKYMNIEGEEKNMKRNNVENLVVVIDMVNGFVKEGALAAPSIQRIIPRIKEILEENEKEEKGLNVIVRDTHTKDSIEFKTFGEHCVEGTDEVELVDELKPYAEKGIDFTKNSTNFMLAEGVIPFLENCYKLKRIAFVGCLSEVCVKNAAITARNYFDQTNRNVEVGVYADAIDTFDAPGHNAEEVTERALADMEANGVKIYRK